MLANTICIRDFQFHRLDKFEAQDKFVQGIMRISAGHFRSNLEVGNPE